MPATGANPFAISWAICRGARFSLFANSKQTGDAASPISIFGGRSSTTVSSTPYFSRICAVSASRNRFESVRYTRPLSVLSPQNRTSIDRSAPAVALAVTRSLALGASETDLKIGHYADVEWVSRPDSRPRPEVRQEWNV